MLTFFFIFCMQTQLTPQAIFQTKNKPITVILEVANTEVKRQQGLMFRQTLLPDHGMLFVFDKMANHSFWMKNTYLSLDMIFIDETKHVVGIVANATPLSLTARSIQDPSRYVLEVNGGFAAKHGIVKGMPVLLPNIKTGE